MSRVTIRKIEDQWVAYHLGYGFTGAAKITVHGTFSDALTHHTSNLVGGGLIISERRLAADFAPEDIS